MIRIIDEPIYSMTRSEYAQLYGQYLQYQAQQPPEYAITFEQWLRNFTGRNYTTYQQEHP
jgi:hypothetical protein